MAYSQDDLDALQAAMAKGARRLKMGDEEVEFRSLAEMERMETKIQNALSSQGRSRVARPPTDTGWR